MTNPSFEPARVAVVVPVHNADAFLAETLDSVLAQHYDDWHVVIVDDVSTDGSIAVAMDYAERHPGRFTIVALRANVGVAEARNRAVAAAGEVELVALLDHDDLLHPDYLERVVAIRDDARREGRSVAVVGCDALLLEPDGLAAESWGERLGWFDRVDLDTLIEQNTLFPRALVERAAILESGGFSSRCPGCDDWDLWLALAQSGREIVVTRERLATYRLHASAQSRDRVGMSLGYVRTLERTLARGGLSSAQQRRVHQRRRHALAGNALARSRAARRQGRHRDSVQLTALAWARIAVVLAEDRRQWRRRAIEVGAGAAARLSAGRWDPRRPGWYRS